jgi:hypothetical protein
MMLVWVLVQDYDLQGGDGGDLVVSYQSEKNGNDPFRALLLHINDLLIVINVVVCCFRSFVGAQRLQQRRLQI